MGYKTLSDALALEGAAPKAGAGGATGGAKTVTFICERAKLAFIPSFSHQPLVVGSKAMDLCSHTCVERKIENIELDERPIARNPGLKMRIPCSRPRIVNSSVEIAFI